MRRQKVDKFGGGESEIGHAVEDLVGGVDGLWDEVVRRRAGVVGATGQELKAGATNAVRDTDGASELDARQRLMMNMMQTRLGNLQVTERDTVCESEGNERLSREFQTEVCGCGSG